MSAAVTLAARAKLALESSEERSRADIVRVYKGFRKIEEARLKILHRAGRGGRENCEMRSDLLDVMLRHLWPVALELSEVPNAAKLPLAVMAVGGFARRNMNPCSDVDITFLLAGNSPHAPAEAAKLISTFVNLLWDLKIPVGDHSTRSVGETFRQANQNFEIKTSLIEARFLAGHEAPFEDLQKRFDKECFLKQEAKFLRDRQRDIAARHTKYEDTPYRQEPNVKNGVGGLREYHNLKWITYAKFRTTDLQELVNRDFLTPTALREIEVAQDFLLRVRTEMHYIERRESDLLTLKLQGLVANHLGYKQRGILRRIEALMRDYYRNTVTMLHRTNEVLDRFHLLTLEEERGGGNGLPGGRTRQDGEIRWLRRQDGPRPKGRPDLRRGSEYL